MQVTKLLEGLLISCIAQLFRDPKINWVNLKKIVKAGLCNESYWYMKNMITRYRKEKWWKSLVSNTYFISIKLRITLHSYIFN